MSSDPMSGGIDKNTLEFAALLKRRTAVRIGFGHIHVGQTRARYDSQMALLTGRQWHERNKAKTAQEDAGIIPLPLGRLIGAKRTTQAPLPLYLEASEVTEEPDTSGILKDWQPVTLSC